MTFDVNQMTEHLGKLDATNCSSEEAIANFLMATLHGYAFQRSHIAKNDTTLIVTVLQAYAKLLQDAGVKVEG